MCIFLDTHVSLAPTHVCLSVGPSVGPLVTLSDFQHVSAFGRPTWKVEERGPQLFLREDPDYFCVFYESVDPDYFCVFYESVFSESVFFESVSFESIFFESVFSKSVYSESVFSKSVFFERVFFESVFSEEKNLTQSLPSPNFFKPSVPGQVRVFRAFASLLQSPVE